VLCGPFPFFFKREERQACYFIKKGLLCLLPLLLFFAVAFDFFYKERDKNKNASALAPASLRDKARFKVFFSTTKKRESRSNSIKTINYFSSKLFI
jgi:hypothetical protein